MLAGEQRLTFTRLSVRKAESWRMSLGMVALFPVILDIHEGADESEHLHHQCPHLHVEIHQEVFVSLASQDFRKVTLVVTV